MADVFKKHPRWADLIWVIGYVDSHGAIHAKIYCTGDTGENHTHAAAFPENPKYKTWRWCKSDGLTSTLFDVEPSSDDWHTIRNWLWKHGCLNPWELTDELAVRFIEDEFESES